jgi:release factor glutamine methyltransferase
VVLSGLEADAGGVLLDYGTGSGAIAVTLAAERPAMRVLALDVSADALEVARLNASTHGVDDRIGFVRSDGLARVPPRFRGELAAIVANPPYIAESEREGLMPDVRDWEPAAALFPGPDPLLHYRRLAAEGAAWLTDGGLLAMEVGAGRADDVCALLEGARWHDITRATDLGGIERVVTARSRS